jgi:hypothetical protein
MDHGDETVSGDIMDDSIRRVRFEALKLAVGRADEHHNADQVVRAAKVFASFIGNGSSPLDDEDSAETEEPKP